MLKSFILIKNVAKFGNQPRNRSAKDFLKCNIIYAQNGMGKSTLSAIVRSAEENNPNYILSRTTLGQPNKPEVNMLTHGSQNPSAIMFDGATWNKSLNNILIFDHDFVENNIYIGDKVEYQQKLGLYEIFVGRKTGSHLSDIMRTDSLLRDLTTKISAAAGAVSKVMNSNLTVEQYVGLTEDTTIDEQIKSLSREQKNVSDRSAIISTGSVRKLGIAVSGLDTLEGNLAISIDTISAAALEAVKSNLTKLDDPQAEAWLGLGHKLSHKTEGKCPYCGQITDPSELASNYSQYFNEQYQGAIRAIKSYRDTLLSSLNSANLVGSTSALSANARADEVWKSTIDGYVPGSFDIDALQKAMDDASKVLGGLLEKKLSDPMRAIDLDGESENALAVLRDNLKLVELYNNIADENNNKITAFKQSLVTVRPLASIQAELNIANDKKRRFSQVPAELCAAYQAGLARKSALEAQKQDIRRELDAVSAEHLEKHMSSINDCLEKYGASFRLNKLIHSHAGGRPNSTFIIQINNEEVKTDGPDNEPSLKTALSTGDKTTLAFAFFIALAMNDGELNKKVVWIDDPISSLDYYRRGNTTKQIGSLFERAEQGFVLSHDADFLSEIWNGYGSHPRTAHEIMRRGSESAIIAWDVARHAETEQKLRVVTLQKYVDDGITDGVTLLGIVQSIRPMLEHAYKAQYPKEFPSSSTLGEFIGTVGSSADGYLVNMLGRLDELKEVNDYIVRYSSHDPSSTTSMLIDTELQNYAKRALTLMRA